MSLASLCIRRPVFTTMLVACPIVLGIVSYFRIGVDLFPNVDLPIVTVTTTLPGASVAEMETGVTKPIEEAVNTVAGIDELKSVTKEGLSVVTVQFLLEKNRDVAAQEVRDKVSTIFATLPSGTQTPVIDKFDLDASPVLTVAVSGRRSLREVSEIADKRIREGLESLSGVGRVTVAGARLRAINVHVDASKLESFGLSIDQVRRALVQQNLELPGGRVDQGGRELVLRTMGRVRESAEFNDVIVAWAGGQPIRVRDIGRADDSNEEPRTLARLDGANAVTLVVQKQSGTNTLDVIEVTKRRLAEIQKTLPADITLRVIRDQSTFIGGSIHEVKKHLILGAVLVALTILAFLRDVRTMILAGFAIPVCIVSTFTLMNVMGFTLNNITMLGLVLAVGIVIDDAIVIHENIFRWMEEKGFPAKKAAELATSEIALAVLATTSSLVVIFLPIAFMSGRVGRFFQSFGITIAFSILISLGVGFTMTPMLCSQFLKPGKHGGQPASGGLYAWLFERPYMASLRFALRRRWVVVLATIAALATTVPLVKVVGFDFIPKDDQSEFEVSITTPEGWTLDRVSEELALVEQKLGALPGAKHLLTTIGDVSGRVGKGAGDVTRASIYVRLAELDERIQGPVDRLIARGPGWLASRLGVKRLEPELDGLSQFAVMRLARGVMASFPDLRSAVALPAAFSGVTNADVEFNVLGPDLEELASYSEEIMRRMRQVPGIVDVDTTLALRKPELRVVIDREKAMDLGIPVQTIASTLRVFVGGDVVTNFKDDSVGEQYDVWLRAEKGDRDDPHVLDELTIPSPVAGLVKLSNVARLVDARGPSQIDRFGRRRKVTIVCNADRIPIGQIVASVNAIVAELEKPTDSTIYFTGRAKTLAETGVNFAIAFGLSLAFMYMILAAQFESFVHPVTILLAVPLTIPFALLSLVALRQPLDIYAIFGLFLLFGIVKKNGILQVDYTNVLRAQGKPRDEAILEANKTRLRPILMTTFMLISGMVPIAIGVGPGTASRASLAKVIIGGQSLSLLLSLLVTPVAYTYFDDAWRLFVRVLRGLGWSPPEETPVTSEHEVSPSEVGR